jgi:hypothetical protein
MFGYGSDGSYISDAAQRINDGKYYDKDGNSVTKYATINQYTKSDAYKAVNVPFCYVT